MIAWVKVTEKNSFRSIVFLSKVWNRQYKYSAEYQKKCKTFWRHCGQSKSNWHWKCMCEQSRRFSRLGKLKNSSEQKAEYFHLKSNRIRHLLAKATCLVIKWGTQRSQKSICCVYLAYSQQVLIIRWQKLFCHLVGLSLWCIFSEISITL